jgi:hypothetical protein
MAHTVRICMDYSSGDCRSVGVTDAQVAAIQQDQIEAFVFNVKETKLPLANSE